MIGPTNLGILLAKTDATSLRYVVETLYTQMRRDNVKDPYGAAELKRVVPEILWTRTYIRNARRTFKELFEASGGGPMAASAVVFVREWLYSPSRSS